MTSRDSFIKIKNKNLFLREIFNEEKTASGKPYIIFLHEGLGSVKLWYDFPVRLCQVTNCHGLLYDRFGHGESDGFISKREKDYLYKEAAEILGEIISILGIKKVILYGHSEGGTIGLIYSALSPESVLAVITEAGHAFLEESTIEGINDTVKIYESTNLKKKLWKYHGDKTENLFRSWSEIWADVSFSDWTIKNYLPGIKCPVLSMLGEQDKYVSKRQLETIADNVGGIVQTHIFSHCGHSPHKEKEEEVMKITAGFINGVLE